MRPGPQHHHPDLRREKVGCSCIPSGRRCNLHPCIPSRSRSSPTGAQRDVCPPPCRHHSGLCSQFPPLRQQKQVYSKESFQERYLHIIMKGSQAQNRTFSKLHPLLRCSKIHPLPSETKSCPCSEKPDHLSCSNRLILIPRSQASRRQTPRHHASGR